mgnify:CR=1 FL=1
MSHPPHGAHHDPYGQPTQQMHAGLTGYPQHSEPASVRYGNPPGRARRRSPVPVVLAVGIPALLIGAALGSGGTYLATRPAATHSSAASPKPIAPTSIFVSGTLSLHQGLGGRGVECTGHGGYDDISAGAQVIVTDAASKTVAVGELDPGARDGEGVCVFPFSLMVPTGETIYGIEVSHRGRVQYQAGQLKQPLSLTLGD